MSPSAFDNLPRKLQDLLHHHQETPVVLHEDKDYKHIVSGGITFLVGNKGRCVVLHDRCASDSSSSSSESVGLESSPPSTARELFPNLRTAHYNLVRRRSLTTTVSNTTVSNTSYPATHAST
jgi:hypothetical protein